MRETSVERYRRIAVVSWAIIGIILLAAVSLFVFNTIRPAILPFVYALALVYILRPLVDLFERKGLPRLAAVVSGFLIFGLVALIFSLTILPPVVGQTVELIESLPLFIQSLADLVESYQIQAESVQIPVWLNNMLVQASLQLQSWGGSALGNVFQFTGDILGGVFNLVVAPVLAFYILKDWHVIQKTLIRLIPVDHREETLEIFHKVDVVLGGFLRGQALVAILVAVLSAIALAVLKVKYALVIGVIAGVLNIIPYFGPIIGAIIAFTVTLPSWQLGLVAVAAFALVQLADALLISPYIMQHQVDLHPVVIMFSLITGGLLYGILGLLLAIPVASVGKALVLHFQERTAAEEEKTEVTAVGQP